MLLEVRTPLRARFFEFQQNKGLILILVYVASQDQKEGEDCLAKLMAVWKMKITGRIGRKTKGALEFLGRSVYRAKDGESALYFGVSRQYMVKIFWGENIKAKPNPAAEQCMRVFLKWLSGNLHFVQRMPAAQCMLVNPKKIVSFCDVSWGVDSVSGAILIYGGCCVQFFSRKQEVPALSSAEAEIISIVDIAKEMVSLGMLLRP